MFTIAFLRYASGGMHCKTFIKCLIVSTVVYISIGLTAKIIFINDYLYYILNIACFLILIFRAPVAPPEKPIKTKQKKYIMKLISILILLILLYISNQVPTNDIRNSILLGIYFQTLTLTNLDKIIYNFMEKVKLKEQEVI